MQLQMIHCIIIASANIKPYELMFDTFCMQPRSYFNVQSAILPLQRADYCIANNESRTFVPTDIRPHAIFDRAEHSCSHQMTTPDIRAHIK